MGKVVSIFSAPTLRVEKLESQHYDGSELLANAGSERGQYRLTETEKARLRRAFQIDERSSEDAAN